jgi:hypothetical protein
LIPDEVIEFFSIYLILPVAVCPLGLSQPLAEMNTRNSFWGKMWLACKADNPTTIYEPTA